MDIINTLPRPIIETILCLLPIEEAARTSVLSREWRYKWTTIPRLEFIQSEKELSPDSSQMSDLERARRNMDKRLELVYTIKHVLLLRQGPIHEFTLAMEAHSTLPEIDQIIIHLARNHTVKKLTFDFYKYSSYGLPLSFFSLHHLTDLYLGNCEIDHKPIFNGFDSLTNLSLDWVGISVTALLHLLSNCPSLKTLYLLVYGESNDFEYPSIMELFKCLPVIEDLTIRGDIIQCLKPLGEASVREELSTSIINGFDSLTNLSLFGIDTNVTSVLHLLSNCPSLKTLELIILDFYEEESHSVMELFKCLPLIEDLTIHGDVIKDMEFPEELSTSLIHLKYCRIQCTYFHDGYGLPFLAVLVKCSPNLEKLRVECGESGDRELEDELEECSIVLGKYTDVWLEHLVELEIRSVDCYYQLVFEFVKYIVVRAPNLKKVSLVADTQATLLAITKDLEAEDTGQTWVSYIHLDLEQVKT